jgi:serine/threonine-protein kinase
VPLLELCEIVRPLVRALAAAHAHGVVHRDLKPDNVFLATTESGRNIKLLDFGIAKLVKAEQQMQQTASGALIGTPMYLAPEQARAQAVDHRADIYTLGGMLFEMLTKRPPFVAATTFEVVAMHLMEPPEHPSTFAPGVPPELDELIVNMLAKEPGARPSLDEVLRVLDRVEDPNRTAPVPKLDRDSARSIAVTSKRQVANAAETVVSLPSFAVKRRPIGAIVAVVVLLAAASTWFALGRGSSATAPPIDAGAAPAPPKVVPIVEPILLDAGVDAAAPPAAIAPDAGVRPRGRTVKHEPPPQVPATVVAPPPPPPVSKGSDEDQLIPRGSVGR